VTKEQTPQDANEGTMGAVASTAGLCHTPGPWECFYKHKYDEWHVSVPLAEGSMKLALFDDGVRSENPEADARLISAAPELLAALQDVVKISDRKHDAWDKAHAAIVKALGHNASN
jgi:hypothetical protein